MSVDKETKGSHRCGRECETGVWKPIPGHPNYEASDAGHIRSLNRSEPFCTRWGCAAIRHRAGRLLRPVLNNNGYLRVSMYKHSWMSVHRLVALAFHGEPPPNKPVANHRDGNKRNNFPENLEWCSHSENERHSYAALGKVAWNKGRRYDTRVAVAVRRRNYERKCFATTDLVWGRGNSVSATAALLGLTTRQVYERLAYTKEVMTNE